MTTNQEMLRAFRIISLVALANDPDEKVPALTKIYKIAHAFSEDCPHPEWWSEIDKVEQELKDL